MNCRESELFEFLQGRLNSGQEQRVSAHLDECQICKQRFLVLLSLDDHELLGRGRVLRLAAVACLITITVCGLLSYRQAGSSLTPQSLAISAPLPVIVLKTRAATARFEAAVAAYSDGRFHETLEIARSLPEGPEVLLLRGGTQYLLGNLRMARSSLESPLLRNSVHGRPALWLLANVSLQEGRIGEARLHLAELASSDGSLRPEAEVLLEALDRVKE